MIPLGVRNTMPMLATSAPGDTPQARLAALTRSDAWSYEIKFDGVRCLALVEGGKATLLSRTRGDLTRKHPAVVQALEKVFSKQDVVLDGELIAMDQQGSMTLPQVARRDAQCAFMVFDVLYSNDRDRRQSPYSVRMVVLDELGNKMLTDGTGGLLRAVRSNDGDKLWATAMEYGMEGIVAKRHTSLYAGGPRSSGAWLKVKAKHRLTALVTDLVAGQGFRKDTVGALRVSLLDDGEWDEVGEVGSGFSSRDLQEIVVVFTAEKPCIVEVEYLTLTADGRLREPVFKALRGDVKPVDCTLDQIREAHRA
jgi:bifunctional non-homologous end joining protein LigD